EPREAPQGIAGRAEPRRRGGDGRGNRVDTRDAGGGVGDRGRDRGVARRRARCAGAARVVWLLARGGGPDAGCGGGHVQGPVTPGAQTVARETECGGGLT